MTISLHKACIIFIYGLGFFPFIWLTGVTIFAFDARLHLGYWPHYGRPDPQFLPEALESNLTLLRVLLLALLCYFPTMLVCYPVLTRLSRMKFRYRPFFFFSAGWFLFLLCLFVPEIDVVSWFMD